MSQFKSAFKLFFLMTLLTGVLYPLVVTVLAQNIFPEKALGSLIIQGDLVKGSRLIGQNFSGEVWFWGRPSANQYDGLNSGGTNLGPTREDLKKQIQERSEKGARFDLLQASASGLDPEVSPEAALSQIDRVAKARGLLPSQKEALAALVEKNIQVRQFHIFGEPRVNVLELNLELEEKFPVHPPGGS